MNLSRRDCLFALGSGIVMRPVAAQGRETLQLFGDDTLRDLLMPMTRMFVASQPGARIDLKLAPPPAGIDGIVAGVSVLAPLAHDATEGEIEPFKRLRGYPPMDVRIGRIGHRATGAAHPPAVYVHAENPLPSLSMTDLARVLTTGQPASDLRRWSQLGLDASRWRAHAVHVYGPRDDGGFITALRNARFGNRPLADHYEALATDEDILDAVRADRFGLGIVGRGDDDERLGGVRLLPLSVAGAAPCVGNLSDVRLGRYPLSGFVHLYVPARRSEEIDPSTRELLRLALSSAGQQLLRALESSPSALVPLPTNELVAERARVG